MTQRERLAVVKLLDAIWLTRPDFMKALEHDDPDGVMDGVAEIEDALTSVQTIVKHSRAAVHQAGAALLLVLLCVSSASADTITARFGAGFRGSLWSATTIVDGVIVDAVGGELYRMNAFETCDGTCDPHWDIGLGVKGWGDPDTPAHDELNQGEWIRLWRPHGYEWQSVTFSSVNNLGWGMVYGSIYPAGPHYRFNILDADAGFRVEIAIDPAYASSPALWIGVKGLDTFFLVESATLRRVAPERQPEPVPEPATLLLMGGGVVVAGAWRWRRA